MIKPEPVSNQTSTLAWQSSNISETNHEKFTQILDYEKQELQIAVDLISPLTLNRPILTFMYRLW